MIDHKSQADSNETPEDVATLYSWANLHGAKYRDFSGPRAIAREEARLRAEAAAEAERQRLAEEAERKRQEEVQLAARRASEEAEAARQAEAERLAEIARQAEAERQAVLAAQEAQRQAALQRTWEPPPPEAYIGDYAPSFGITPDVSADLASVGIPVSEFAQEEPRVQSATTAQDQYRPATQFSHFPAATGQFHAQTPHTQANGPLPGVSQGQIPAQPQRQIPSQIPSQASEHAPVPAGGHSHEAPPAFQAQPRWADTVPPPSPRPAATTSSPSRSSASRESAPVAKQVSNSSNPMGYDIYADSQFSMPDYPDTSAQSADSQDQPAAFRPAWLAAPEPQPPQPPRYIPQEPRHENRQEPRYVPQVPLPPAPVAAPRYATPQPAEHYGEQNFAPPQRQPQPQFNSVPMRLSDPANSGSPNHTARPDSQGETNIDPRERGQNRWYALKSLFDPQAAAAEQIQQAPPPRAPVLAVFSLAGGVGKTSLVASLGRALSTYGERVLLVDTAAYGLLPFFFGARDQRPGQLRTFNPPGVSVEAPIQLVTLDPEGQAPDTSGNPQQTPESASNPASNQDWLANEVGRYTRGVNRVLVDLPTASGSTTRRVLRLNPVVLVPILPDMNSVVSVGAIESFFRHNGNINGKQIMPYYLLNQFDYSLPLHLDVREILREQIGDRLLPFALRRSSAVSEALAEGMTVIDYAPSTIAAEDYASLAGWVRSLSAPATQMNRGVRWSER